MPSDRTIDELAHEVGLPSSTIRLYQSRGLLPPPRRRGRVALYDDGHVARIDLIGRLQERGFSLAAIGELVAGWEEGRSLDDVLGIERLVPGALDRPVPLRLGPDELAARFPAIEITPEILALVAGMGMVTVEDGEIVIGDPAFLDVGVALVELGFPLDEVLEEAVRLHQDMADVAERFTAMFERHVWRPFADAGRPPGELARVEDTLRRLGPLADAVVQATLRRALTGAADAFLAREAERATP